MYHVTNSFLKNVYYNVRYHRFIDTLFIVDDHDNADRYLSFNEYEALFNYVCDTIDKIEDPYFLNWIELNFQLKKIAD